MYFGDVVFAVSGALTAGRYRMDIVGFVLVGTSCRVLWHERNGLPGRTRWGSRLSGLSAVMLH
ncbi:MAG: TRIC cation channel family protein [Deltaproteobacteria bacterium]